MRSIIPYLLLLAFGLEACGSSEEPTEAAAVEPVRVVVWEAAPLQVPRTYSFPARLAADRSVNLSTKLTGRIDQLPVEQGQPVRAGQLIARIQSQDLQSRAAQLEAQEKEAQAALNRIEKDLKRFRELVDEQSAPPKQLDDLQAEYEMAQARLERIQKSKMEVNDALSYAVLRAPFSGKITGKFFSAGDLATPGQPIVTIQSQNALKVLAQVSEYDIGQVAVGDTVEVEVEAAGAGAFSGKVDRITPPARSGAYELTIRPVLTGQQAKTLQVGMFARAYLRKGADPTLLLPRDALIEQGQLQGIYVMTPENRAVLRWLRTGKAVDDQVEIISGLRAGETVILEANGQLSNGQPVEVTERRRDRHITEKVR